MSKKGDKSGFVLLLLTAFLFLNSCTQSRAPSTEQEIERISLRLNWQPGAEHVAYYIAAEKGFYKEVGLDVDIIVGSGSADSVRLVAAGSVSFALAAGGSIIQGRAEGMPIRAVAVIYQDDPTAFTVLKDSGITNLHDLVGHKIGVAFDSSTYPEYLALMQRNTIDRTSVTEIPVSFGVEPLLTGQVDAFPGFLTQVPLLVELEGYEAHVIPFKDYGINIYGVSIVTNEDMLLEHPELVRNFVQASLKGWEYVFENREDAVDTLLSQFPELDRQKLTQELDLLIPLILTDHTQEVGLGYSSGERWQDSVEILYEQNVIEDRIDISTLYTNEFLGSVQK